MTKKRMIILGASVLGVLIVGITAFALSRRASTVVKVYDFENVGMTEYWGDNKESYGPVSTDKIQTVFLSDTQEVTEILVSEGDTVKKGDLLMRFDTTMNDLTLERKRLEVEKVKLQLADAKDDLVRIKNMKPLVPREPEEIKEDPGNVMTTIEYVTTVSKDEDYARYTGQSKDSPMVIWLLQNQGPKDLTSAQVAEIVATCNQFRDKVAELKNADAEEGAEPVVPTYVSNGIYAVLKYTDGDYDKKYASIFQGVYLKLEGEGDSLRFSLSYLFDAGSMTDPLDHTDPPSTPKPDDSSGYTYAEIQKMRQAKEKEIKELEFKVKTTEAAYQIAVKEMGDGNIHAVTDGRITSLLTPEEAKERHAPILKLSGGGGFYVKGSVNELDRESLTIGQAVNIQDWSNGGFYEGTVASIGEFPVPGENYSYGSNPNASYYPFTVFVDESADLAAGSYVSIQYSLEGSAGVYLQKPFLRTEGGESYVLVQGERGRLEKRTVTTGKSLWGSYVQITSGLSRDDLIAFPYGKNVKAGVRCEKGDMADLYAY